ncbi:MAG: hypothetical protein AAGI23_21720 [Bacteroidota bacterium]
MGVRIHIITAFPEQRYKFGYRKSDYFNRLLSGVPYDSSEISQICKLFDLDKSELEKLCGSDDLNLPYDDIERCNILIQNGDQESLLKAEQIKEEYLSTTEKQPTWIDIEGLIELFQQMKASIVKQPLFYKQIRKGFKWYNYFDTENINLAALKYPIDLPQNILEDLFQIENHLQELKQLRHEYIIMFEM